MASLNPKCDVLVLLLVIFSNVHTEEHCYPAQASKDSGHHTCIVDELKYNYNYHVCCANHKIKGLKAVKIPNHGHPLPPGCALPLTFDDEEEVHCPVRQTLTTTQGTKMCCTDPNTGTGIQAAGYMNNFGRGVFSDNQNMGGSFSDPLTALYSQGLSVNGRMLNPLAALQMGLNSQGQPMPNLPGTPTNVPRGFMNNPTMAFNPSRCRNFMHPTHGDNDCSHNAASRCSDSRWQSIMFSNCAETCIRMGVRVPGC